MRDIVFVLAILVFTGLAFRYAYAGTLTWGWLTLMNPQIMLYGFGLGFPFNFVIAIFTVLVWVFSNDKKNWPRDLLPRLMVVFVVWMTFNSFFAVDPDWSWPLWSRTVKIFAFIFLCFSMINSKARIHAMVWVMAVSIGFFSLKGGVFVLMTGGNYHVYGPPNTIISDNNQLALAVVMILPLTYYLLTQTRNKVLRIGIGLNIPLQIITVLGSYSRGGLIALSVVLGFFWLRSKHKLRHIVLASALMGGALLLMPPAYFDRVHTIDDAQPDDSVQGRFNAWQVAYDYAVEHFPLGDGFAGAQLKSVFNYYLPGAMPHAAHSIYFEVLGDHGFVGLFIYLLAAGLSLRNTRLVIKRCKGHPELLWVQDLTTMVEISLIGFYVGGAALSMAYYDGLLLLQAFTSILRFMTEPQRLEAEGRVRGGEFLRGSDRREVVGSGGGNPLRSV